MPVDRWCSWQITFFFFFTGGLSSWATTDHNGGCRPRLTSRQSFVRCTATGRGHVWIRIGNWACYTTASSDGIRGWRWGQVRHQRIQKALTNNLIEALAEDVVNWTQRTEKLKIYKYYFSAVFCFVRPPRAMRRRWVLVSARRWKMRTYSHSRWYCAT